MATDSLKMCLRTKFLIYLFGEGGWGGGVGGT